MIEVEQVKPATTPEEMRQEIFRLMRYDALVRSVMDAATHMGFSGEDRYTALAYTALKQLAHIKQHVLSDLAMRPLQPIFVRSDNPHRRD